MALARDAKGEKFKVVAVIGDGASPVAWHWKQLTMGHLPKTNLLVVLNDNEMSISPNVGAISRHLNKMRLSPPSAVHLRQPQGTGQADPLVGDLQS